MSKGSSFLLYLVALLFAGGCITSCGSSAAYLNNDVVGGMSYGREASVISNDVLPGDILELFVLEDQSLNATFRVFENGDVVVPKVGPITLRGMSMAAAEGAIRRRISETQLANPTVSLHRVSRRAAQTFEEKPKMLIYVAGAVRNPGQHMIALVGSQPILAYEALLIAGGATEFADERRAYVLRRKSGAERSIIPLNLREIRQGTLKDVILQEGDLITVPERRFGLSF